MNAKIQKFVDVQEELNRVEGRYNACYTDLALNSIEILQILMFEFKNVRSCSMSTLRSIFKQNFVKFQMAVQFFLCVPYADLEQLDVIPEVREFIYDKDLETISIAVWSNMKRDFTLMWPIEYLDLSVDELIARFKVDVIEPLMQETEKEEREELDRLIAKYGILK